MGKNNYKILLASLLCASCSTINHSSVQTNCPIEKQSNTPALNAKFLNSPIISKEDAISDFNFWLDKMLSLNPDIGARADLNIINNEASKIKSSINQDMTTRELWLKIAKINEFLGDGHNAIAMPNYRKNLANHISSGGKIFPLEVRITKDNSLMVSKSDNSKIAIGTKITKINGINSDEIIRQMLQITSGDSKKFRQAWIARRFEPLFWLIYGDTGQYDIEYLSNDGDCTKSIRLQGSSKIPEPLMQTLNPELFIDSKVIGDIGYFRVSGFDFELKEFLAQKSQAAFLEFKDKNIKALIIDIRDNGGGDDPLWQQSLMEYITDKQYAHVSKYKIRVTPQNADPGDVIGSVQANEYKKRFSPSPNNPLRFKGPVYILTGPFTYSAAIQFAVAAQDYNIAKIIGEETGALSCQTGRIIFIEMLHSKLGAFTPISSFTRPSGQGCSNGIIPDIKIEFDEVKPNDTLNSAINIIKAEIK